jgi:hypothetical protein
MLRAAALEPVIEFPNLIDYLTHYQGHARTETAEAGDWLLDAKTQMVVRAVCIIKEDTQAKGMQHEFYAAPTA